MDILSKYIKQGLNQYILLLLLLLLFLCCCSCSNKEQLEFANNKNIKNFIANLCPISNVVDTNQNIILGTLYYKENSSALSPKDKIILEQITKVFQLCHKKIIIIGYASNKEALNNPKKAAKISYYRAQNAYDYLKNSIPENCLFLGFLSNFRNKYIEKNKTAIFGNQRVEIIMLGSGVTSLNLLDK